MGVCEKRYKAAAGSAKCNLGEYLEMKCFDCPYHKSGYMYNSCAVTFDEYFMEPENCDLVNDDGSLNYDNEFIKMEYGEQV